MFEGALKRFFQSIWAGVIDSVVLAGRAGLWRFLLADMFVWLVGSGAVYVVESGQETTRLRSFWETLYFCWISMTTVGYGDITPITASGRAVIMTMVLAHIFIIAMLSAAVASMLVARRLKEGRGLEKVRMENHLVICGWNRNGDRLLKHLSEFQEERIPVALVNNLEEDQATAIVESYPPLEVRWVSGDYTQESVLERANVRRARAAIILADYTLHDPDKSDERAILATLALKEIRSDLLLVAEVLTEGAKPHLRRARADEIVVAGESDAFFLLSSTLAPGLNRMIRNALSPDGGLEVWLADIPRHLVGKTFADILAHFYGERGEIVLGVITHEPGISLKQVLSDDYTAVDRFIEEKFRRAQMGSARQAGFNPRLNPPKDYVIGERDRAVCLRKSRHPE